MIGKKEWAIGDGFLSDTKNGAYESHESVCVLNTDKETAVIEFYVYFEDREPMQKFVLECGGERARHIRLDKITNECGEKIPHNVPYAMLINSSVPIVVQYSRLDVSQPEMTLMTTIAY